MKYTVLIYEIMLAQAKSSNQRDSNAYTNRIHPGIEDIKTRHGKETIRTSALPQRVYRIRQ